MARNSVFFMVALLLLLSITSMAIRHEPALPSDSPNKTQQASLDEEKLDTDEGCEGVNENECLMRRTLAAHIDYIYTQNKKP